jgi:6-phosphogluconolactonase/glucosamine-6-phosphate isomerase/deaminase
MINVIIHNQNMTDKESTNKTMRNHWFEHVAKTRKKMSRGKKETISHRAAMTEASQTWPNAKKKILNKIKRSQKIPKATGIMKLP